MGRLIPIASPPAQAPALSVRALSVAFGPTRALRDVDLDVRGGEVVALLGQNGAGKSTLIKVLAGVHRPSAGTVTINAPLAFVHQDLALLEPLSVAENIAHVAGFATGRGFIAWRRQNADARALLARWELDIPVEAPVRSLDPAQRALVAIARALAVDARVIVLDEPTAALPSHDVDVLLAAIERLRAAGVGFLYVTHRLGEVARIADRIVVLRDGSRVADVSANGATHDDVVTMIVGRELSGERISLAAPAAEVALELDDVSAPGIEGVSLKLRRGEVLAAVGLVGAGQRSLGQVVAGVRAARGGVMSLAGRTYSPRCTRDALRRGVAFLPADRLREGGFLASTTGANLWLRAGASGTLLRNRAERSRAGEILDDWAVTPSSPVALFSALSGGNQQRVLLAKWMESRPEVFVVDEPSAGVDVGARQAIHQRIADAAAAGVATVLVSSDAEEVAELAHRALVLRDGRVACELAGAELNVKRITLECVRGDSPRSEI